MAWLRNGPATRGFFLVYGVVQFSAVHSIFNSARIRTRSFVSKASMQSSVNGLGQFLNRGP
jgi:hypothetical protein